MHRSTSGQSHRPSLIAQGIGKGDVVAVFIENRPELLVTILAVAKVGAISALLNTSQTRDTLVHSLNLVAPVAIVVGEELVAAFLRYANRYRSPRPHLVCR
jgi:citronellyl-CoA synthetase